MPAIVRNACRTPPVFAVMSSEMAALPVPDVGRTRIQDSLDEADQGHPCVAVSAIDPLVVPAFRSRLVGFSEYEHPTAV
jgi:hypothetical protein